LELYFLSPKAPPWRAVGLRHFTLLLLLLEPNLMELNLSELTLTFFDSISLNLIEFAVTNLTLFNPI
jgi:hypothetical protein